MRKFSSSEASTILEFLLGAREEGLIDGDLSMNLEELIQIKGGYLNLSSIARFFAYIAVIFIFISICIMLFTKQLIEFFRYLREKVDLSKEQWFKVISFFTVFLYALAFFYRILNPHRSGSFEVLLFVCSFFSFIAVYIHGDLIKELVTQHFNYDDWSTGSERYSMCCALSIIWGISGLFFGSSVVWFLFVSSFVICIVYPDQDIHLKKETTQPSSQKKVNEEKNELKKETKGFQRHFSIKNPFKRTPKSVDKPSPSSSKPKPKPRQPVKFFFTKDLSKVNRMERVLMFGMVLICFSIVLLLPLIRNLPFSNISSMSRFCGFLLIYPYFLILSLFGPRFITLFFLKEGARTPTPNFFNLDVGITIIMFVVSFSFMIIGSFFQDFATSSAGIITIIISIFAHYTILTFGRVHFTFFFLGIGIIFWILSVIVETFTW